VVVGAIQTDLFEQLRGDEGADVVTAGEQGQDASIDLFEVREPFHDAFVVQALPENLEEIRGDGGWLDLFGELDEAFGRGEPQQLEQLGLFHAGQVLEAELFAVHPPFNILQVGQREGDRGVGFDQLVKAAMEGEEDDHVPLVTLEGSQGHRVAAGHGLPELVVRLSLAWPGIHRGAFNLKS